ncbi:hypothetical protein AQS8620_02662 [Aquimixticola soesokkakensis]|uniref:Uncharacterized protein n=1 Tax=Aquimixticola soesokkakensis TaxID=1519096 RepID=A0A1Y5TDK9_9RHOB|nr:hypothetical protein AQS8620_02662 [Aquimixticola soesokkakensis]
MTGINEEKALGGTLAAREHKPDPRTLEKIADLRAQMRETVLPLRLSAENLNSGKINSLSDVTASDQATTSRVLANFKQVTTGGDLRLHPLVDRLMGAETLRKTGATPGGTAGETLQ